MSDGCDTHGSDDTDGTLELRGGQVTLRTVTAEHVPRLRDILATPEVRGRWGDEAASAQWPFDDPSSVRFAVMTPDHSAGEADAEQIVGMIQYGEEDEPAYRHASIDIFLDPAAHGRHIGRDAVRVLARHLIEDRGHHRLVIDPAADNAAAIRCYAAVGFRPVGTMRNYERDVDADTWHDGLLMDLLAAELET